jgi:hypothetical protein
MSFFLHPIKSLSEFITQLDKSSSKINKYISTSLSSTVLPIFKFIENFFTKLGHTFNKKFRATPHTDKDQNKRINNIVQKISKRPIQKTDSQHQIQFEPAIDPRPSVAGFSKIDVPSDGNCFFHALALGFGRQDESAHEDLRKDFVTCLNNYLLKESNREHLESILANEIMDWLGQEQQKLQQTFSTFRFFISNGLDTTQLKNEMLETMNIFRHILCLEEYNEQGHESFEQYFEKFRQLLEQYCDEQDMSGLRDFYVEKLGSPDFYVGKIAWEVMAKSKDVRIVIHTINEEDLLNQYPVSHTINPMGECKNEVHLAFKGRHYDYLGPNPLN